MHAEGVGGRDEHVSGVHAVAADVVGEALLDRTAASVNRSE
jgi:hypothetical protein